MSNESSGSNAGRIWIEKLESGVVLIRLGSPEERLVTLTAARLESLRDALAELKANPPKGIVITGPNAEMFAAGADINVINSLSNAQEAAGLAERGQQIFQLIADQPARTVAAISGPCVGGGCEMVLACKYRVISDHASSTIGLPEIKLGILPGFGGTQRLPRLVGLPKALDIILAGKTLRPKQALSAGLVNEIVPYEQLISHAEAVALGQTGRGDHKLKIADRILTFTKFGRLIVRRKAGAAALRQSKGFYPAVPAALECCLYGLERGQSEGLKKEAQELGRLVVTPECKALVHVFFLTESAKSIGKAARKEIEHLQTIVVGAGTMGAGIAGVLAKTGIDVILKENSERALEKGLRHIRSYLADLKYLSESERSLIFNRIKATNKDPGEAKTARLAIEAVFEQMDVKRQVLSELAQAVDDECIIATNTSSLSVSAVAEGVSRPERVIGLHFFNPVEKMPLVEIVQSELSGSKPVVVAAAVTSKLGKYPIIVKDVPGFLVNRILAPYLMEAGYLLSEGAGVTAIDRAATSFGLPMGPIRLLDEVGLDIAAHVSVSMVEAYGERMRGPDHVSKLVGRGRLGKKSGAGFYEYKEGKAEADPQIYEIVGLPAPQVNVDHSALSDRLVLRLVNEAVRCLDEGVAGAPGRDAARQIDLGTVMGIGFPPFRGGVLYYAQQLGARELYERLSRLSEKYGERFAPADGLRSRAERGIDFYSAV